MGSSASDAACSEAPASTDGRGLLDVERLDVYRVARQVYGLACTFPLRGEGELRDQLRRGALSIVLNIAEGVGRPRGSADRARFYAMARGSATECAALVDMVALRGLVPPAEGRRGRVLLVRIIDALALALLAVASCVPTPVAPRGLRSKKSSIEGRR